MGHWLQKLDFVTLFRGESELLPSRAAVAGVEQLSPGSGNMQVSCAGRGRCSASLASTRRSSSASPPGRSWASTRCTWSRPTCSRRASSAARCSTGGLRKRTGRRTAPAAVARSGAEWHAGHEDGTQRRGMACWSRGWCAAARNGALVPFAARWVPKTCPTT